jgi:hypothetical protein
MADDFVEHDEELMEDEFDDIPEGEGGNVFDSLQEQFGAAPWWVISAVFHAALLAFLATLVLMSQEPPEKETVVQAVPIPPKPPEKKEKIRRDITKQDRTVPSETDLEVETPIITHEKVEITDHVETENNMDLNTAKGQEDAISDIPMAATGWSGSIGVGGGGGGAYGFRTGGGRKRAAMGNGGSVASESAVDAALAWLARNQEPDGSWACQKHGGKMDEEIAVGLTGLAVLAFLGAGHTERSGIYKKNVVNGVRYLIGRQAANGEVGRNEGYSHGGGYNHAIAGLALAEAFGMAQVPSTGTAAQKAVDYTCEVHQKEYDGWRYKAKQNGDLSVTGWYIMQLKSAKVANLSIPGQSIDGALNFLDKVELKDREHNGYTGGIFCYQPGKHVGTPRISSVGMLGRLFLGFPPGDLMGGAELLSDNVPSWDKGDFYYWYYGTLVMFQVGGEHWKQWNVPMRDMLIEKQRRGGPEDGSWDPDHTYGKRAGRAFSTAVGALCLEVYYRYLPMYK